MILKIGGQRVSNIFSLFIRDLWKSIIYPDLGMAVDAMNSSMKLDVMR